MIIDKMQKTLVLGASLKPDRYSNLAVQRLLEKGVPTEAYGLKEGVIKGLEIKTNFDAIKEIHTVTLYLNPKRQEDFYQPILQLKPKRVIFNPGTENPAFYALLKKEGIEVEVACTLVLLATNQYECLP